MKRLLLICATLANLSAFAQSAEEKAWLAYMTPGEPHQLMEREAGEWAAEITFFDTGAEPSHSSTVCSTEMILGGRYQKSVFTGDMMGTPFEGISTTGYDNARKVYFSTWIDNMGTGIMYAEGKYNTAKKTLELKGKMTDPKSGKAIDFREVHQSTGDDSKIMEMYVTENGKETKTMEIKFNRR